jgi:hypothetical protein
MTMALLQTAQADELHVVLNGKAIHLQNRNYNEDNWGLGINYDFAARNNWINFLNASFFKDSNNQTSKYAGGGTKRRYLLDSKDTDGWHIDAGIIGFLMTREDYKENQPFFGALPFVAVGKSWFTVNATYIPAMTPKHTSLFFFQAMVRVAEF